MKQGAGAKTETKKGQAVPSIVNAYPLYDWRVEGANYGEKFLTFIVHVVVETPPARAIRAVFYIFPGASGVPETQPKKVKVRRSSA